MKYEVIDGLTLRMMLESAAALMEANRQKLNELNVFPVPDGDTGTNMSMTMQSVVKELSLAPSDELSAMARTMSRGALKGARGNSGVILSQILRGFSQKFELVHEAGPADFIEGLRVATDIAYKAVMKPKEGTILTVLRSMAEATQKNMRGKTLEEVLAYAVSVGDDTLSKTPDMLPQLKKAGVVDAGGQGLMTVMHAFLAVISGESLPENLETFTFTSVDDSISRPTAEEVAEMDEITFAYCTEFFIQQLKPNVNEHSVNKLRSRLSKIGDSLIVVGDPELVKVHVHTNDPGQALQYALELGELYKVKIENMVQQHRELEAAKAAEAPVEQKPVGVVAVASGDGLAQIFKDLGADAVVSGGQTMNPSTADLADAVEKVPGEAVILLPNNGNIILAAEQVQGLTNKKVFVVHSKTIPQGISATLNFDSSLSAEENYDAMENGFGDILTGSVTYAVRDTEFDGKAIHENDILGLNGSQIASCGQSKKDVTLDLCRQMLSQKEGLLTLYFGADTSREEADELLAVLQGEYPSCDFEVVSGGQPVYYYLISIE